MRRGTATGVCILAGGEGRRIGGDKPMRELAGAPLLTRALARARDWSGHVAVAFRDAGQSSQVRDLGGVDILHDDPAVAGPLAGLLSGLRWARGHGLRTVLTIPCDMPFLPPDLAERLSAALAGGGARPDRPGVAVAMSAGRLHPVCALWTVDAEPVLLREAGAGKLSLVNLCGKLGGTSVEWPAADVDPFFNVNTAAELARAEALLAPRAG